MNHLHAPVTDIDDPTLVLAFLGKAARSYSRFFTESAFAERLSPTRSVRRAGFGTRLDVVRVCPVATDVVTITLARPDRSPLPRWTPGAHLDVFTPSGRRRHYSLTGDRFDPVHYTIAVRRIPDGAGSVELQNLSAGDTLHVRGPRNSFTLAPAEDYLFVAGGIGITPITPMLREVARRGTPWRLIYTGRTRESMPFVGTVVSGFPNFFMILGPNSVVYTSQIVTIEAQVAYILDAIRQVREEGIRSIDVSESTQQRFIDDVDRVLAHSVWNTGGCQSYYLSPSGRNVTFWPGFVFTFERRMRHARLEEFDVRYGMRPPADTTTALVGDR